MPMRLIAPRARESWAALLAALATVDPPCASAPDAWFTESTAAAAAEACSGCPARQPCGQYAHDARESAGVWAGRQYPIAKRNARATTTPTKGT